MKIYVASSWRNEIQQEIVRLLREAGHGVYDFKNPAPGNTGFHWSEIDPQWRTWSPRQFKDALCTEIAGAGFWSDMGALEECDICVLVLPCGRSAHLEAGWAVGAGKPMVILLTCDMEPELMYGMASNLCTDVNDLLETVKSIAASIRRCRVCGCTDDNACPGGCYWVEDDLCSSYTADTHTTDLVDKEDPPC